MIWVQHNAFIQQSFKLDRENKVQRISKLYLDSEMCELKRHKRNSLERNRLNSKKEFVCDLNFPLKQQIDRDNIILIWNKQPIESPIELAKEKQQVKKRLGNMRSACDSPFLRQC